MVKRMRSSNEPRPILSEQGVIESAPRRVIATQDILTHYVRGVLSVLTAFLHLKDVIALFKVNPNLRRMNNSCGVANLVAHAFIHFNKPMSVFNYNRLLEHAEKFRVPLFPSLAIRSFFQASQEDIPLNPTYYSHALFNHFKPES